MTQDNRIVVTGLRELREALAAMSVEASTELDALLVDLAETVARKVRTQVPHRTGRAANSYVAKATTRGASVGFGGGGKKTGAPYVPWLEFGGSTGRGHVPRKANSGSVKRTWVPKGRWLYPEIEQQVPELNDRFVGEMDTLLRKYGIEVDP